MYYCLLKKKMLSKNLTVQLKVDHPDYEMRIQHVHDKVTSSTAPVIYFWCKISKRYFNFYQFVCFLLSCTVEPLERSEKGLFFFDK
jgi:hypothetical protein